MNEDGIVRALERLASAVENQNALQLDWVEIQKRWHKENEEANAQRHQDYAKWHDETEAESRQRYQENVEREQEHQRQQVEAIKQSAYQAYLEVYKSREHQP